MPPKRNPLKLNPLQLRTLAILQRMARSPRHAGGPDPTGAITVAGFPAPHHDHIHVGDAVVMGRDATGLHNPAVFAALQRKGLAHAAGDGSAVITVEGLAYDTGLDALFHHADH